MKKKLLGGLSTAATLATAGAATISCGEDDKEKQLDQKDTGAQVIAGGKPNNNGPEVTPQAQTGTQQVQTQTGGQTVQTQTGTQQVQTQTQQVVTQPLPASQPAAQPVQQPAGPAQPIMSVDDLDPSKLFQAVTITGTHAQVRLLVDEKVNVLTEKLIDEAADELAQAPGNEAVTVVSIQLIEDESEASDDADVFTSGEFAPGNAVNPEILRAALAGAHITTPLPTQLPNMDGVALQAAVSEVVAAGSAFTSTLNKQELQELIIEWRDNWTPQELGITPITFKDHDITSTFENLSIDNAGDSISMIYTLTKNGTKLRMTVHVQPFEHTKPRTPVTRAQIMNIINDPFVQGMHISRLSESELMTLLPGDNYGIRGAKLGIINPKIPSDCDLYYVFENGGNGYTGGTLHVKMRIEGNGYLEEVPIKITPTKKTDATALMTIFKDMKVTDTPTLLAAKIDGYNSNRQVSRNLTAYQLSKLFPSLTEAKIPVADRTKYVTRFDVDVQPGDYHWQTEIKVTARVTNPAGKALENNSKEFKIILSPFDFNPIKSMLADTVTATASSLRYLNTGANNMHRIDAFNGIELVKDGFTIPEYIILGDGIIFDSVDRSVAGQATIQARVPVKHKGIKRADGWLLEDFHSLTLILTEA